MPEKEEIVEVVEFFIKVPKGCKIQKIEGVDITEVKHPEWSCRIVG